ncbi:MULTISPECIES: hypothetical protein [unclassified Caballeronia]|uniref:hypothetical protein n=1 Tax=unclassified Caballeronia TaxID=2646786 RepID=UPI00286BCAD9|nr:hypothetical protein [Caballeronia sp. LZ008]
MKYRFTDAADLEQYVHFTLLVNPKFDEHPVVRRILKEANGKSGAFGGAMQKLPASLLREIKSDKFDRMTSGKETG